MKDEDEEAMRELMKIMKMKDSSDWQEVCNRREERNSATEGTKEER